MKVHNETQEQHFKEIGATLKQAREEKSLRIEEIEIKTRIRALYLRALENGKYEELPETIYVRGFIHRYADLVGLDGKALAEQFSETFLKEEPKENIESIQSKANFTLPLLSLFYIFLIVLASFGLFSILNLRPKTESTVEDRSSPSVSSPTTAPTSKVASSKKPTKPTPKPTPTQKAPAKSTVKVSINLKDRSWVEVEVDQTSVFKGFMTKGQNKSWTAKQELTVRAGNASAVFLSRDDGEPKQMGAQGEVTQITFKPEAANSTTPPQQISVDG